MNKNMNNKKFYKKETNNKKEANNNPKMNNRKKPYNSSYSKNDSNKNSRTNNRKVHNFSYLNNDSSFNKNNQKRIFKKDTEELSLNNFPSGYNKKRKRIGRGSGSGWGKTAGRGMKGQKSRSGGMKAHFEGGQTPYYKTVPKVGAGKSILNKKKKIFKINNIALKEKNLTPNSSPEEFKKSFKIAHYYKRVKVFGKGNNKVFNLNHNKKRNLKGYNKQKTDSAKQNFSRKKNNKLDN